MAEITSSGGISRAQGKSIGHCLRKQGEQGVSEAFRRMCWLGWSLSSMGEPGQVSSGEVLRKGVRTVVPAAAATCIGPVSLVRKISQRLARGASSERAVLPVS